MSNENINLGNYNKVYSDLKKESFSAKTMQRATDAIEELDLDVDALKGLESRISSNATDAKAGDFIDKSKIHITSSVWTDGSISFKDRGDGSYYIIKNDNGKEEILGFTDKLGVEAYYSINNQASIEVEKPKTEVNTNSNIETQNTVDVLNLNIENQLNNLTNLENSTNNSLAFGSAIQTAKELLENQKKMEFEKEMAERNLNRENIIIDNLEDNSETLKNLKEVRYQQMGNEIYENANYFTPAPKKEIVLDFDTYNLSASQIKQIAKLCVAEQGNSPEACAAEASLMANRFETVLGGKYKGLTGADGLVAYIKNSGWWYNSRGYMEGSSKKASEDVINAVESVLVDGKRTLPKYVDEHDWVGDLASVTNNGVRINKKDSSQYIPHISKCNQDTSRISGGESWTYYCHPRENSDPFGYSSEKKRAKYGEDHYDFKTGEVVSIESYKKA